MVGLVDKAVLQLKIKKHMKFVNNTALNDLRKTICLRKIEVFVGQISVCNVTEKVGKTWQTSLRKEFALSPR